jgi:hypothetical protein
MTGIPKQRKVLVDESGNLRGLGKLSGLSQTAILTSSGTINYDGLILISGTQFKWDSIVVGNYKDTSAPTSDLVFKSVEGVLTVAGDASTDFYYVVFNQTS